MTRDSRSAYSTGIRGTPKRVLLQIVGQGDGVTDVSVVHAPLALFPTPFPGTEFRLVQRSMPAFSMMVQAISESNEYLNNVLKLAAQYDEFTGKLLTLHNETIEARNRFGSPITLGLHRSDYMLDGPSNRLLQVLILPCSSLERQSFLRMTPGPVLQCATPPVPHNVVWFPSFIGVTKSMPDH